MVHNTLFHSSRRSWRCPYQKHRSFIKWHSVFGRVQHTVDNRRTTSTFDVHHKTSCTSRGPWTSLPPRKIGNTSSGSIACLWASMQQPLVLAVCERTILSERTDAVWKTTRIGKTVQGLIIMSILSTVLWVCIIIFRQMTWLVLHIARKI